ncbi:hypothetical protein NUITMVS3_25170 [Shewanella xiamenensis]|nr:hypothetical protein ABT47_22955 [Shewanella xiamenensis]BDQ68360.1 hypothetical protein NUITMVS2_41730 [Shewanella xiamenensis]GLD78085.1 hypothetical protein NUITMVS3_25170 [Shewanella xiamenensis]
MRQSYYAFAKFSLFRISVLTLSFPFLFICLVYVTNTSLYDYGIPLSWICISSIPILFCWYKIDIDCKDDTVIITRSLFTIPIFKHTFKMDVNTVVQWLPSQFNKGTFKLMAGEVDLGLTIDR